MPWKDRSAMDEKASFTTLIEKYVGLDEIVKGHWRVYYRDTLLGYLDEKELRIQDQLGRLLRAAK